MASGRAPSTFTEKPLPWGCSYPWRKLLTNSSGRTVPAVRQLPVTQGAAGVSVAGGVHVQGEGRQVVGRDALAGRAVLRLARPVLLLPRGGGRSGGGPLAPGRSAAADDTAVACGVCGRARTAAPGDQDAARQKERECSPMRPCPAFHTYPHVVDICECDVRGGRAESSEALRNRLDGATTGVGGAERQGQDTMSSRLNHRKGTALPWCAVRHRCAGQLTNRLNRRREQPYHEAVRGVDEEGSWSNCQT